MKISFVESKPISLSIKTGQEAKDIINVGHAIGFTEADNKRFVVHFDVKINTEQGATVDLVYAGFFAADTELTDELQNSDLIKISAPAITFPYLRAYVGNLTLSSGIEPITLPLVNFQSLVRSGEIEDAAANDQ